MLHIDFSSGLYIARPPRFDPTMPAPVGFRWSKHLNAWTTANVKKVIPYADNCVGEAKLRVDEILYQRKLSIADSMAMDAPIRIPANPGLSYRGYQKAGIAFAKKRKDTLLADAMRLGKTVQAIGLCNTLEDLEHVLVVCPASVKVNWRREMVKWLVKPLQVGVVEGDHNIKAAVTVINYDILWRHREWLETVPWDVIIYDEAHYLRNAKSGRTLACLGGQVRAGENYKPLQAKTHRLFLTGTPQYGRPVDLFTLCKACDPDGLGKNWWTFVHRYCDAKRDGFSLDVTGASNLEELQMFMRQRFMIRREKTDVAAEVPPNRQNIVLPKKGLEALIKKEAKIVASEVDSFKNFLTGGIIDESAINDVLATFRLNEEGDVEGNESLAAIRKSLALKKLPMCFEFLDELIAAEKKVVVFGYHREVIEQLHARYGERSVVLYGGMVPHARQASVDRFQDDPTCELFIGNILAAGQGIRLDAADVVVFIEQTWTPSEMDQAEERVWDVTKTRPVSIYKLLVEDSLDLAMASILDQRQKDITKTMVAASIEGI